MLLFAALALVALVAADTPANCSNTQALGIWKFYLGYNQNFNNLNCSAFTIEDAGDIAFFDLKAPDVVEDEMHNKGFWTFIYNQGFEVVVDDYKYFAFSNWTYANGTTDIISNCHQTFPGWYHDIAGSNWGCYIAIQLNKGGGDSLSTRNVEKSSSTGLWREDPDFVNKINSEKRLWTATDYPQFVGKPLSTMRHIAGNYNVKLPKTNKNDEDISNLDLPASFDWRNVSGVNFVTPVRDQGDCGSCYSFGSTAALEARIKIQSNNEQNVILSPQQILSCGEYMQGCNGGFPYLVYKFGEDFGIMEESCFPYTAKDPSTGGPSCSQACQNPILWSITDYEYVGGYYGGCSAKAMMKEIYDYGPISIGFEVLNSFMSYSGGIYDGCSNPVSGGVNFFELTNHAVMISGWGVENGTEYWIVKNSWGTSWGLDGYFYILRGVNECAIESMASRAFPKI